MHKISFESKTILVHKSGVQKIPLTNQEKFWGPEKYSSPNNYVLKTNLDIKGLRLQKKFGKNKSFGST